MRNFIFFMLMMFCTVTVSAQSEPANYAAAVSKFKQYYNNNQPDSVFAMFSPDMKTALPIDNFTATTKQLRSQLGNLNSTKFIQYAAPIGEYEATFQNGMFMLNIGLNSQSQFTGLRLTPPAAKPVETTATDPSIIESSIVLKTMSGTTIYGTLAMPADAKGKVPVVLIIAGSGPTDRNGNNNMGLNTNTYKLLANALGKAGIASVRYDKRMIGQSVGTQKESDLRFEDYSDDAVGFINMLSDDNRFSKVIVAGHSEGSLVGMLACHDEPVKGFISLAGAGEPGEKILTEQMKSQPGYASEGLKKVLDSLKRGKINPNVDPSLYGLLRPSIQMYIMSWCRYDPAVEIRKVKCPILIVQGTTDMQVTVDNATKLKNAKSSAIILIVRGMNHILKDGPTEREANLATYKDPNLPLNTEMVTGVIDFINKL
jgi:pimeloyl-ACP methyl ester carboxylesterase